MKSHTALVDLNLHAGHLDFLWDPASLFNRRPRRESFPFGRSLLSGYMAAHSSKLQLLPAPRETADADDIKPENVAEVLHILRQRYDYVVIDPHHTLDAITLAALDNADDILLVLTLMFPRFAAPQRSIADI